LVSRAMALRATFGAKEPVGWSGAVVVTSEAESQEMTSGVSALTRSTSIVIIDESMSGFRLLTAGSEMIRRMVSMNVDIAVP
jgi:hypothetical protein